MINLSLAGCGFLGIYHIGVAACFRKYAPHLVVDKISGASFGAIAASCLILDIPLGETTSDVLRVATEARKRSLGPFNPSFNIHQLLFEGLERFLPEDAHTRVSGKLHISLTRLYDGKNVIVSQFDTRDELIQALLASAFIPLFSGIIPPKYKGVRYMDGGYSDNLPTLDEHTITVSPFCGESDICPRDDSSQLFHINVANTSIEVSKYNMYRMARILFPPPPETLANMCKQGFDDALRFLHRNNLINCTKCLAVQSTFVVSDTLDEHLVYDPQCKDCKLHRQEALVSNVPDTVLNVFQEVIESANKGVSNWLFKHRGMKLLSVLSLPYTLPADIMYATFTKIKPMMIKPRLNRKLVTHYATKLQLSNLIGNDLEQFSCEYRPCQAVVSCHTNSNVSPILPLTRSIRMHERFMSTAPQVGNTLWDISKVALDQLSNLLHRVNRKRQQLSAKIICQLAITEYGGDSKIIDQDLAENKMNLNFTLNLDECELPLKQPERQFNTKEVLKRQPSFTIDKTDTMDDDTFEHILKVTSEHEAIMAYYYLDENNKVKVTEIFDVSTDESPILQTQHEKEVNENLEYDDSWTGANLITSEIDQLEDAPSEYSIEDLLDNDKGIFSDPESEWVGGPSKIEEPEDEDDDDDDKDEDGDLANDHSVTNDTRPESERTIKPINIPINNNLSDKEKIVVSAK